MESAPLTCAKCGDGRSGFYSYLDSRSGRRVRMSWCKDCARNMSKRRSRVRPVRPDDVHNTDVEALWVAQKGLCALCAEPMLRSGIKPDSVVVDHDHRCFATPHRSCGNCVRGLIHRRCNILIGVAHDDPVLLQKAASYLQRVEEATLRRGAA